MGSQALSGLKAYVAVKYGSPLTWGTMSESTAATLNLDAETSEVTNRTSSQSGGISWRELIPVCCGWSASIDCNLTDHASQQALEAALLAHTTLDFGFAFSSASGTRAFRGTGYVVSASKSYPNKAASSVTYQIAPASALSATTLPLS